MLKTINTVNKPKLTLVGAGPGDPDLISIKGMKVLVDADVILYDALVDTDLLKYASSKALKRRDCWARLDTRVKPGYDDEDCGEDCVPDPTIEPKDAPGKGFGPALKIKPDSRGTSPGMTEESVDWLNGIRRWNGRRGPAAAGSPVSC